jgi:hypothetical protein
MIYPFRYRQAALTMFNLSIRTCPFYCFLLLIFYISYHTHICYLAVNLINILLLDTLSAGVTTYMINKSLLTLLSSLKYAYKYHNMTKNNNTLLEQYKKSKIAKLKLLTRI